MRGRWSAGLARVYWVSDRSMSEPRRDLVQRRVSRAWPHKPSMQSVTYLVKHEWPEIALFYAVARLANDVTHAPARLVMPDLRRTREGCWCRGPTMSSGQTEASQNAREPRRLVVAWFGGARAWKHQSSSPEPPRVVHCQCPASATCCSPSDRSLRNFGPCSAVALLASSLEGRMGGIDLGHPVVLLNDELVLLVDDFRLGFRQAKRWPGSRGVRPLRARRLISNDRSKRPH